MADKTIGERTDEELVESLVPKSRYLAGDAIVGPAAHVEMMRRLKQSVEASDKPTVFTEFTD